MRDDIKVGDRVWVDINLGYWARVREIHADLWTSGGYYVQAQYKIYSVPAEKVMSNSQYKREMIRLRNMEKRRLK